MSLGPLISEGISPDVYVDARVDDARLEAVLAVSFGVSPPCLFEPETQAREFLAALGTKTVFTVVRFDRRHFLIKLNVYSAPGLDLEPALSDLAARLGSRCLVDCGQNDADDAGIVVEPAGRCAAVRFRLDSGIGSGTDPEIVIETWPEVRPRQGH